MVEGEGDDGGDFEDEVVAGSAVVVSFDSFSSRL